MTEHLGLGGPFILTAGFLGFPHTHQVNTAILAYLKFGHDRFCPHPFEFIIH
jgi:hypothetical protein